jgi:hypothetical protein
LTLAQSSPSTQHRPPNEVKKNRPIYPHFPAYAPCLSEIRHTEHLPKPRHARFLRLVAAVHKKAINAMPGECNFFVSNVSLPSEGMPHSAQKRYTSSRNCRRMVASALCRALREGGATW